MAVQRDQVIRTAEKYVSKGRIEAAIREYRKVLRDQSQDVNTLNRLGDLYARLQRYDEAVELFEQIAKGYTADGFFVKAIAIYKKIIKLDPTRLETYEELAELYHKQGLVNEARTQYQVLADYYLKHDNLVSAAGIYEKMVDLEPENPSHHAKLAEIYTQQKLLDKAIEEYVTIAGLMIDHGHPEEATKVLIRGVAVDPSNVGFITNAVLRFREAGHEGEAAHFLSLAVERNPAAEKVARLVGMTEKGEGTAVRAAEEAPPAPAAPAEPPPREPEEVSPPSFAEESSSAAATMLGQEDELAFSLRDGDSAETSVLEEPTESIDLGELEEPVSLGEPQSAVEAPRAAAPAGGAVRQETGTEFELDLDEVFVLDLEDDEPSPSLVQPPPDMLDGRPARAFVDIEEEPPPTEAPPAPRQAPAEAAPAAASTTSGSGAVEIDPDFLERTTAELEPAKVPNEGDLVSEAEVLAKYGMVDKAVERLEEALGLNAYCFEAHELLIRIRLDQKQEEKIPRLARRMAAAAAEAGQPEVWRQVRGRLESLGFRIEGANVEAPRPRAPRKTSGEDRINRLLEDLLGEAAPRKARRRPAETTPGEPPAHEPPPAEPSSEPPRAAAGPPEGYPESMDDFTLHGIFDEVKVEPPAAGAPPESGEAAAAEATLEDSGTSWLDQVDAPDTVAAGASTPVFEDEDDFFDLAGELEQELTEEGALGERDLLVEAQEQTLEEIVEGFKRGVAASLSPEDYDTHFNLGIAYREMGLLDEAIGEFQIAAKDRAHLVECCSMLGLCFLDKGLPELSVKWYRQALSAPDLEEEESLGLLYEMGNAYLVLDDRESARKTFVELYGINSNYRDVVAKLEELRDA